MWLGWNAVRSGGEMKVNNIKTADSSLRKLFVKGVFANAINPKVMLFFISFLPQFVVAEHGKANWQTAALGAIFTIQAAVMFGLLGFFSGAVGQWLSQKPQAGVWLDRIAGVIFISLGLRLIVSR